MREYLISNSRDKSIINWNITKMQSWAATFLNVTTSDNLTTVLRFLLHAKLGKKIPLRVKMESGLNS